ncbi:hypothetical protein KIW84_056685 [Lathyrus oleraceus]|uniref:ABC1 atypical kinase-like domain-containing protein n=1 Tax=Pisum sativum TaxID=3888 RepID=A0A9D4X048_PEA|nr:hypothetical protein KIW84_056685 [Pisum sativum]
MKSHILSSKSQGVWDVLLEVVAVLYHAEIGFKRQRLIDALEISCVPVTALQFIGLLSVTCCKYMPFINVDQQTVLIDLPNTHMIGQCSLRQLLEYGYFHADPHPGNLLATPDGRLAFLDFGMMSETPEDARSAIIGHVVHLVNRDYKAMARDYDVLDFLSPDVDVSPIYKDYVVAEHQALLNASKCPLYQACFPLHLWKLLNNQSSLHKKFPATNITAIVVTESGWPSKGASSEPDTTIDNANNYNSNYGQDSATVDAFIQRCNLDPDSFITVSPREMDDCNGHGSNMQ